MKKTFFHIIFLCFLTYTLNAQSICITENLITNAIETGLVSVSEVEHLKSSRAINRTDEIYTIPVVFHIVHNGENIGIGANISEETIVQQLASLNRDFNGSNADSIEIPTIFKDVFADVNVRFELAKEDENGLVTTAIERYNFGNVGYTEDSIENIIKPQTIWNRDQFLNIWVCSFAGSLSNNSILGYAQPPLFSFDATTDGIVLRTDVVGENGRTAVHEIGHYFGLFHIFGNDNGECPGDLGGVDDGILDTPPQADPNYNCPSAQVFSCGNEDMYVNYMDYTDDECSLMFTEEQTSLMHGVLQNFRNSVALSGKHIANRDLLITEILLPNPTGSVCQQTFYPAVMVQNIGKDTINFFEIEFLFDNSLIETYQFSGEILPLEEHLNLFNALAILDNNQYLLNFEIVNVDNEGNEYFYNNTVSTTISTVSTGNGVPLPVESDFNSLTTFPTNNLSIQNFDNGETWQLYNANGIECAFIENFNNPVSAVDNLVTNDISLTILKPLLSFDVAYAQRTAASDTLSIFLSQDCGVTWIPIWQKFGAELANQQIENNYYEPDFSDFKKELVYLENFNELKKARFKFESKSGNGNNIYLDNINISDSTILSISSNQWLEFEMFPNPAATQLNFNTSTELETIQIYNTLMQLVYTESLITNSVDIATFPSGIYYVVVSSKTGEQSIKSFVKE